jgi:hypothetical protein
VGFARETKRWVAEASVHIGPSPTRYADTQRVAIPQLGDAQAESPMARSCTAAPLCSVGSASWAQTHTPFEANLADDPTSATEGRLTSSNEMSVELSSRRTGMSFQRTRMSADRTLMSVIRTSLSLISFGLRSSSSFSV